jgi:hypothetical protein
MSLTPMQRYNRAVGSMESAAMNLLHFVETYSAQSENCQGYHLSKRRDLLERARDYGAAVRRVARLRA